MERRSLTGGFKSNVSLGGVGVAYNPPPEMAELAVKAADILDLDITGIDILLDEEGYRICEANSAPGFQGLERARARRDLDDPGMDRRHAGCAGARAGRRREQCWPI
jgi:glutathione synthase/RimK-type ligase-like ATP-grasp enzyme